MDPKEIIGLVASLFIAISLAFKTTTFRGTVLLRILNSLGCIFFIIYGFLLPAYATAISNGLCLILNVVFLIVEIKKQNDRKA